MKRNLFILLILAISLFGCEGDFAGDRGSNVEILNGSYRMRLLNLDTTRLAVLNTNFSFTTSEGSLQFYALDATTEDPDLTISLPNNVSDFYYDEPSKALFIVDRNNDQLLVYDFTNSAFVQRTSGGVPVVVDTLRNPQSLTIFNGTVSQDSAPERLLAVTCQSTGTTGTIQFVRLTQDLELVGVSNLNTQDNSEAEVLTIANEPGALLEMIARQVSTSGRDDRIDIPFSQQIGRGVQEIVVVGGAQEILVTNSALNNALFGFHFLTFDNASNFVWDLERYYRGFNLENGTKHVGTREKGFRGLAVDQTGNVFATSRTDNSIYKLAASSFEATRVARESGRGRNTRGFDENDRDFRLDIEFDDDVTDKIFPRLGAIAVNNAGTLGWVVGLESDLVYKVELADGGAVSSAAVGELPQALLYDQDNDRLYVSASKGNKITVFEASTLTEVYTIEN